MQRKILPYNPTLKPLADRLRKNLTLSEALLWNELKQGKMRGLDFTKQRPILNYIVDFYAKDIMLAIEIDGSSHNDNLDADVIRQKELESVGVRFLRFLDTDVKHNLNGVVIAIGLWIDEHVAKEGFTGRF